MLFVPERRRSRRLQARSARSVRGERAIKLGSGVAVVRRSEGSCFSSPSDDEVGGFKRDPRGASAASGAIKQGAIKSACRIDSSSG
jgi:hypothetical protein